jgi:hypothetical protein
MATKKRKAPNKTENTLTAAAQAVAALPAPATKETIEQAAELFASLAATTVAAVLEDREVLRQAYGIIESRLHPDNGADRDAWEAFQNAAVLLERHHVAQERQRRLTADIRIR